MAFHYLSYLVPTKVTVKQKTWTPSIPDSQQAFLKIVTNSNAIVGEMKKQKAICDMRGIPDHPIVFVLEKSESNKYFVGLCETVYEIESVIDAVDAAFKFFVMFEIPFPPQAVKFWLFLNQIFYKIDLPQKPNYKMVSVLNSFHL